MKNYGGQLLAVLILHIFYTCLASTTCAISADQGACVQDAAKFCSADAGRGDTLYCLKAHEGELSSSCLQQVNLGTRNNERIGRYNLACRDEISRLCANVVDDAENVRTCLNKNENELSAACKEAVIVKEERIQRAKEFHEACRNDVKALCADKRSKRLGAQRCLTENKDKLSAQCQEFMEKTSKSNENAQYRSGNGK